MAVQVKCGSIEVVVTDPARTTRVELNFTCHHDPSRVARLAAAEIARLAARPRKPHPGWYFGF